jgi:hypothetical protein
MEREGSIPLQHFAVEESQVNAAKRVPSPTVNAA